VHAASSRQGLIDCELWSVVVQQDRGLTLCLELSRLAFGLLARSTRSCTCFTVCCVACCPCSAGQSGLHYRVRLRAENGVSASCICGPKLRGSSFSMPCWGPALCEIALLQ
jgi:hypothetical protein